MSKKLFYMILGGLIFTGVSVLAYTLTSGEVLYETSDNITDGNGNSYVDVQDALDELYTRVGTKYTITFNAQNGSEATTIKSGTKQIVENLPTPTKDGKYFAGWYDAEVGGNRITESSVIDSNTTLYAHWADSQFGADSWDTIATNVRSGNTSIYHVGDTKEVDLGDYGVHKVRVANNSNYDCTFESKTACGFVVEFAGVITTHKMSKYVENSTNIGENSNGGWLASEMRNWLNQTLLVAMPKDLQNVIADTTVVSGHEKNITTNYTTTDKLYLLSTAEVWQDVDGNISDGIDYYDKSYSATRQLDYYTGVTTSNYGNAIKQNNSSNSYWWLRSGHSNDNNGFFNVGPSGSWNYFSSYNSFGVSPAFRIG